MLLQGRHLLYTDLKSDYKSSFIEEEKEYETRKTYEKKKRHKGKYRTQGKKRRKTRNVNENTILRVKRAWR